MEFEKEVFKNKNRIPMFKIRNKKNGELYPKKKYYHNMSSVRRAFRKIMNKYKINRAELEIVEYCISEKEND